MKLSIIIPVYNEENTIEILIKKVLNNQYLIKKWLLLMIIQQIIFKNIDKFKDLPDIKILRHDKNKGKVPALELQ